MNPELMSQLSAHITQAAANYMLLAVLVGIPIYLSYRAFKGLFDFRRNGPKPKPEPSRFDKFIRASIFRLGSLLAMSIATAGGILIVSGILETAESIFGIAMVVRGFSTIFVSIAIGGIAYAYDDRHSRVDELLEPNHDEDEDEEEDDDDE